MLGGELQQFVSQMARAPRCGPQSARIRCGRYRRTPGRRHGSRRRLRSRRRLTTPAWCRSPRWRDTAVCVAPVAATIAVTDCSVRQIVCRISQARGVGQQREIARDRHEHALEIVSRGVAPRPARRLRFGFRTHLNINIFAWTHIVNARRSAWNRRTAVNARLRSSGSAARRRTSVGTDPRRRIARRRVRRG